MKKFLIVAGIVALLSGCATQPTATSQAREAQSSAIIASQQMTPKAGMGGLVVKRDTGIMGSACLYRIFVDGAPVVDLRAAEKFEFYLPTGNHIIGAMPATLCGGGTSEAQVTIVENRTVTFRLSSGQSGDIRLQPSAF